MLVGLLKFDQPRDYLQLLAPIYHTKAHIYVRSSDHKVINNIHELNGRRWVLSAGYFMIAT